MHIPSCMSLQRHWLGLCTVGHYVKREISVVASCMSWPTSPTCRYSRRRLASGSLRAWRTTPALLPPSLSWWVQSWTLIYLAHRRSPGFRRWWLSMDSQRIPSLSIVVFVPCCPQTWKPLLDWGRQVWLLFFVQCCATVLLGSRLHLQPSCNNPSLPW